MGKYFNVDVAFQLIELLEKNKVAARVILYGSPAEEGGGGKVLMMEKGILEGIDMALMAHPGAVDAVEVNVLAMVAATVTFYGGYYSMVCTFKVKSSLYHYTVIIFRPYSNMEGKSSFQSERFFKRFCQLIISDVRRF